MLDILGPIINAITSIISRLGYAGIFSLMVLESALIPIPSEIIMPFSGFLVFGGKLNFWSVVLAGSIGNLVGSIATYYLGKKVGRAFIVKYGKYILFKEHHLELTERWFQKYGDKISFIGRLLPGVRTYVSLPVGIGETSFKKFIIYTFAGAIIWNSFLCYAGFQLGNNWKNIEKYSPILDGIAVAVIIVLIVAFIRYTKKNQAKERQQARNNTSEK